MNPNPDILHSPLRPGDIEWRVQNQSKDGQKLCIVPYLTNRVVMERFDQAFGAFGWQSSFQEISDGFLCTLSVLNSDGQWVSRTDGSNRSDIEPIKGGISNAMKRCAVQFGLGRDLYRYPKVYLQTTDKFIPAWSERLLDALVTKMNQGGAVRDVVVLKQDDVKKLQPA